MREFRILIGEFRVYKINYEFHLYHNSNHNGYQGMRNDFCLNHFVVLKASKMKQAFAEDLKNTKHLGFFLLLKLLE